MSLPWFLHSTNDKFWHHQLWIAISWKETKNANKKKPQQSVGALYREKKGREVVPIWVEDRRRQKSVTEQIRRQWQQIKPENICVLRFWGCVWGRWLSERVMLLGSEVLLIISLRILRKNVLLIKSAMVHQKRGKDAYLDKNKSTITTKMRKDTNYLNIFIGRLLFST